MAIKLLEAERTALQAMKDGPLEIEAATADSVCAILVCSSLAKRGFCHHRRVGATLARFTITGDGLELLNTCGSA